MKLPPTFRPSLLAALTFGHLITSALFAQSTKVSVETFFAKPLVAQPSVAPDGKTLAFALRDEQDKDQDDYALSVLKLEKMESKNIKLSGRSTGPVLWMDHNRLVLGSSYQGYSVFHLNKMKAYSFNMREGLSILSARRDQPDWLNVNFWEGDGSLRAGPAIIDPARQPPDSITAINARYNIKQWFDIPPGERGGYALDWRGQLRLLIVYHQKAISYYYRADESSPWQKLPLNVYDHKLFAFHPDPTKLYFVSRQGDEPTASVHLFDVSTLTMGATVFSDPDFAMTEASAYVSPVDGSLLGLHYQKDAPASHWFSAPMQAVQAAIDAKITGRVNAVIDYDNALEAFLISSITDRSPPLYFLYQKSQGTFAALPDPYPGLRKAALRPTQSIRFKARDGLKLQGYLTLPAPRADGTKPPLIVVAHGGPTARDTWGFNEEVQFLASRGYAVFQPNYRGSSGFNREISDDQMYDFKATHEDVTDAVNILKRSGQIDPRRIAIMGASYGGYLAVCGAAFEPDLYKCAITVVGVFDWVKRVKDRKGYRFDRSSEDFFLRRFGDTEAEVTAARLDAGSPIHFVDQIKIPIYVSHGKDDGNVDATQSTKLVSALKKNGVPVETFFPDTEGHGYFYQKNRLRLYREIEAFLAKHL